MPERLPPQYAPAEVEEPLYRLWLERDAFRAPLDPARPPFSIVLPPPNVTGQLHIGHALNGTVQDVLIRWRRMQGYATLWLPGTDHAGIATQAVVEKRLAEEGTSRHELGRERFVERVWDWKEEYEARIISQFKRLGASCDWSRLRFTMDEGLSRAVEEVFVRYFEKGLIYRGDYMVNWCPRCGTAISDLEVNHEEREGHLWHLRYPAAGGGGGVVVATTRPETMLGDTAVAVHPDDPRYTHLVGRTLLLPLVGREIPVVADPHVDPAFGTGAVKVTPAHDPNDFAIGERHGLPRVQVIGPDGRMTAEAGPYAGLDRYECRRRVIDDLRDQGLLAAEEEHRHAVGHCDRCGTVVEPLVSRQWFVRMRPLAEPALEAVRRGEVRFIPERFERIYTHWLEEIRDWCISRQLWWGHRIPAWECRACGEVTVAREADAPERCPRCGGAELERDPDVLDTWFSSALWPFSTLGWPEETEEMRRFYPTSVLVTAYDIIFFWVARMIWSALEFTGRVPFSDVLITGLVRDAEGRKMSKSLGNGVDPIEVIEKYGADTLRFTLITGNSPGNDQRFHWERVEGSRNFCNKVWNAARFALMHLEDGEAGWLLPEAEAAGRIRREGRPEDRWLLHRLDEVAERATAYLEAYELGEAARLLYDFLWSELCDWYLEMVKPRLYGEPGPDREVAQAVLRLALDRSLRLLHPFLPFLTEAIWQHLPRLEGDGELLALAAWPSPRPEWRDAAAVAQVEGWMEAIRAIRNLRAEVQLPPSRTAETWIEVAPGEIDRFSTGASLIELLARAQPLHLVVEGGLPREGFGKALSAVLARGRAWLPLAGLVDLDRELARLRKEEESLRQELARTQAKLGKEEFLRKAPPEVVAKEEAKREELAARLERLRERLAQLAG